MENPTAAWKYSAPTETFFDGADTFRYHVVRDLLAGHKLPGDEKIDYTCSIQPGNIFLRSFWIDRLLAMVFLSGNLHKTDHTLPPIEPNGSTSPTRDFTSTGDSVNAVVKATFAPSTTRNRLGESIPYCRRNPIERAYWQRLDRRVGELLTGRSKLLNRSSATGMSIIGISGGGKTTATEAALNLTPQVILHSSFRGETFTSTQVVWLKLQCPFDGSVRGLCIAFFDAMDKFLGTNHLQNYVSGRRTVDELLPHMARVASVHALGLLVIDEIQHLSQSKSGGKERMLNFFCQLVNTIGVPVVFIGTYKAMSVLGDEFRQIRRGSGEGDFVWERMLNDAKWKFFVEALWTYQYVRNQSPLTQELSDTLYDESQGITDFAVKLYMLAQVRAIASRKEVITPATIRSVASDSLRMAQPVLRALQNGNTTALQLLSDVQPIDFAEQARRIRASAENLVIKTQPIENVNAVSSSSRAEKTENTAPKNAASDKSVCIVPESLPAIVASGGKQQLSPYDSLKAGGLIRDQMEFLIKS